MRASWLTGPLLAFAMLAMFPARAYAHHCHTAHHCFEQGQPASAFAVVAGILLLVGLSIAIDLNPYTGFARGLHGTVTGRDLITGDELGTWERLTGWVPWVGRVGSLLRTGRSMPRYVDRTINAFKKTARVMDAAGTVRGATGAATGIDPLTGENLSGWDRMMRGAEAGGVPGPVITASELFKNRVAGPGDYPVRGGGEWLRADGIREDNRYLQEAKYYGSPPGDNPLSSDSRTPSPVRDRIRQQAEDEVYKYSRIIKSPDSPYQGLEYITTDDGAKRFYEDLFLKYDVPGHVSVEE